MVESPKNLNDLKKSVKDKRIAGICGGFGEYTNMPAWIWRSIFLMLIFLGGIGPIAYIILWFNMPSGETLGID
jgi:phage shock protein C